MAIDSAIPARAAEQKSRLLAALGHEHPDRVPLDLGSTAVTGIHVSCVAELRDYYGLQRRPVKIHEPYQMLGLVEDDLRAAMGIDTVGAFPAKTLFGFPNEGWKQWTFRGLDVLVPEQFVVRTEPNSERHLPRGRHFGPSARPILSSRASRPENCSTTPMTR